MAGGQGAAGGGGAGAALRRLAVIVHDRAQAEAALALEASHGVDVLLLTAPGAARYLGVGYLEALGRRLGRDILVDCGDEAGVAMAGLRAGLRRLLFRGPAETLGRLQAMAVQQGASVVGEVGRPVLVLAPGEAPVRGLSSRPPSCAGPCPAPRHSA
jgi:hypothetical protein